ncbi:acyl carrier protein [Rhodoligotrophos defluvii]|uniref:acyl carrier protein n=1 Tax=Rhodoligotrophos defluvii TaxID=2561934 RepID=UPI0010C9B5EB|nr:phosphopantetheine-binding protein [Rhodoligotrophos defluvii]
MVESKEQIFEELSRLIAPFNIKGVPITPATDIAADLNIDSVAVMDFVMEIEDRFDIDIPLNLLAEIRTMDELTQVVRERIERGGSA